MIGPPKLYTPQADKRACLLLISVLYFVRLRFVVLRRPLFALLLSHLLRKLLLLAHLGARSPPPHIASPSNEPLRSTEGCDGGSDVEVEDGFAGGFGLARVVVDDVSDFLFDAADLAGDEPVVSVKGRLGSARVC